jgi:molecular chaperone GrpE
MMSEKTKKVVTKKTKKNNTAIKEDSLQINELNEKIKDLEERILRNQAEMMNFKRRKEEETEQFLKYANMELIREILPILDNFERAINMDDDNPDDEVSRFLEGFKMIYDKLKQVLFNSGVEEIEALGNKFDPNFHEAVMTEEDETQEEGTVLEVLQKGYKLEGRIIRPAMVKVNK